MGFGSVWHWVIVLLVVLVLFGRGRIAETMGDFGKGIKSFKAGMSDEADRPLPPRIAPPPAAMPAETPVVPAATSDASPTPVDPGRASAAPPPRDDAA
ncbi:MAG TPA: twin-arginine translocase TatA/TatE family subunit [Novosphingobium sp.]|nr:twin-arginine translocase TatA/TatE family subunit [Novosphingobium sp.]